MSEERIHTEVNVKEANVGLGCFHTNGMSILSVVECVLEKDKRQNCPMSKTALHSF